VIDGVLLEVLRNRFQAIVEDMARVMERTAFTAFVKETADFSVGLVSTGGEYVAYPWNLGATCYLGMKMDQTLGAFEEYAPGDVVICNDPYLAGPLCTHLPDIHMLLPIFHDGRLVCWAYAFVHSSDVGGAVPASVWPKATEIYQEGLRIRPTKLYRAGALNQDVLRLLLDNTRIPDLNWGDLQAMTAAVKTGERQVREAVDRFGVEVFVEGVEAVLDHGEQRARRVLARVPDGTYGFVDYLEGDSRDEPPVRLKTSLTFRDGAVTVDFTGTDPQVSSALNLASGGVTHPFLCLGLVAYMVSRDPEIPKASSIVRPITVVAPEGTVVNSRFPAPVGVRYATALRVADTVLGALAQAIPGQVPAAPGGFISPIVLSVPAPDTGARLVQVVEPLLGGSGGRADADGIDGADSTTAGYLRNTPVESVEAELPVLVRRYGLIPDSGGAGRYRGGAAVQLDIQNHSPGAIVTARALERFALQPWGLAGGGAGRRGRCVLNPGTPHERELGRIDVLRLEPGDVLGLRSSSGGGYGDPYTRDPRAVAGDVRAGLVTAEWARRGYGVVIEGVGVEGATVDEDATARLRSGRRCGPPPEVEFGDGRHDLERRWPPEVQDFVHDRLGRLPLAVRDHAKALMYRAVAVERRGQVSPEDLRRLWDRALAAVRPVP
jgi:N-methylhydantoinase B